MRGILSFIIVAGLVFGLSFHVDAAKPKKGKDAPAATTHNGKDVYVPVQTVPTDLDLFDVSKVKDVLKSNMIQMANNSVIVLDNVWTPLIYEQDARDFLAKLVKGRTVGLYINPTKTQDGRADIRGNLYAHVVLDDGTWVQQSLVAAGLAWVNTTENSRDLTEPLLKDEIAARAQHKGFWKNSSLQVKNVDNIDGNQGKFVVFEGEVNQVRSNGMYEIDVFQKDPQHWAVTLIYNKANFWMWPKFADSGREFSSYYLTHAKVRARGFVETYRGAPMIRINNPEQIEYPNGPPDTTHGVPK